MDNGETWWSLRPLVKPSLPALTDQDQKWVRNPIDAFIIAKLREKKLSPFPEADRPTLIRRLFFDLTGLPPTYAEVEAFVQDQDPQAYEKLVDRLLASQRYGERWARHWLDVVHYGETHGYDKDKPRPNAWPYRDYVIRAFNEDKPYRRFVQEQIAGDVLYPDTPDGIEALGFLSAGPWDFIGHAEVPETKIDGKIARHLDRDDMVSNTMGAFVSLTVHCAQCHHHKFDPIPQDDYYNLQAVFAAIDRTDRAYDPEPGLAAKRAVLDQRRQVLSDRKTQVNQRIEKKAGPKLAELDARLKTLQTTNAKVNAAFGWHSNIESRQDAIKWVQIDLKQSVGIRSVVLHPCRDDFNNIGDGFGFPKRYRVEASHDPQFKSGVMTIADETQADVFNPGVAPKAHTAKPVRARYVRITATKLAQRSNDYIFALAEVTILDLDGNNAALAKGVEITSIDSIEAPPRWGRTNLIDGWHPGFGSGDLAVLKDTIQVQNQRAEILRSSIVPEDQSELAEVDRELTKIISEQGSLPPKKLAFVGSVHHGSGTFRGTGADGGKPRKISILMRGDVQKPGKAAQPAGLSCLNAPEYPSQFALAANHQEGDRRAALARWLTDSRNPLTWRSIVNRVWLYHWGRGLVETPNDFGRMGQLPTHPELLDWLAAEFRDNGQSLKALHRLIVTSATYRQPTMSKPEFAAIDSGNQYYWRMNRRRLEAEAIRDSILMAAGKLDLTMYGPSFQDFIVEKPEHSPHYEYRLHDPDDPRSHRRSVYRFLVRSQQQPFMTVMDCADPSMAVDKRNQTITPLQALSLLNNQLTITMAKRFAERIQSSHPQAKVADQATEAFRIALSRTPNPDEQAAVSAYAQKHGLMNLCRMLYNLNEFVFVD